MLEAKRSLVPSFLVLLLSTSLAARTSAIQAPAEGAEGRAEHLEAEDLRQEVRRMITAARDRVFPALVHIEVITARYEEGREARDRSQGSGILITSEGHVLTNEHVVNRGVQFRCTLTDRRKVSAKLVGEDPLTDLAVLKLNLSEFPDDGRNLPVARFGESSKLETGDYVMAMGSPFALSRSVTLGIVSNTARTLPPEILGNPNGMELEPGQSTGLFTLWIQHDALINPGNSGGPLVDLAGDIVGINEIGGASIGFAIPSDLARRVAMELIKHGEVPRSTIGTSFRPITDTGLTSGVLVDSVAADSPAARVGIRAGDVILSLGGQAVTVRFPEEVPRLASRIADEAIGATLEITYQRDGVVHKAEIVTEKLLRDQGQEDSFPTWGFTAQQITQKMARDLGITSNTGALITGIRSGSPAYLAQPALARGDLILAIGGTPIHGLSGIMTEYQRIQKEKSQPPVLVAFDRRGKSYLTLLKSRTDPEGSAAREVLKPWMGIATQPILGEMGELLGLPDARGYRITRVYPETAAAKAGLKVGDLILAIDGEQLTPRGIEDAGLLDLKVRNLEIGQTVDLLILRDGKTDKRTVVLERNLVTPPQARHEADSDLGLTAREVTFFDRDENRWSDDIRGVIVEQVEPASCALLGGLYPSDLIQSIGRHEIHDLLSYREALSKIATERPKRVEIIVLRGTNTHLLYVEPPEDLHSKN